MRGHGQEVRLCSKCHEKSLESCDQSSDISHCIFLMNLAAGRE